MNKTYATLIQESASDLEAKQKGRVKVAIYQRLQMLRLLKSTRAKTLVEAASLVGVAARSIQRWWKQYRLDGLESLLVLAATRQPRLSTEQQQTLLEESGKGGFSTIAEIAS